MMMRHCPQGLLRLDKIRVFPQRDFLFLGVCMLSFSITSDSETLRTVTNQIPLSVDFSRQEYWNMLPLIPPRDLPNLEIKPAFLSSALAGRFFTTMLPGKLRLKRLGSRLFL